MAMVHYVFIIKRTPVYARQEKPEKNIAGKMSKYRKRVTLHCFTKNHTKKKN